MSAELNGLQTAYADALGIREQQARAYIRDQYPDDEPEPHELSDNGLKLLTPVSRPPEDDPFIADPFIAQRAPIAQPTAGGGQRKIRLTPASAIKIRPVHWLWEGRIPLASLALIAGREGIGKSTFLQTLIAMITRGRLPGQYFGTPRNVILCATEESWEHTIVPRLMAAGADLSRVFRVDVVTGEGIDAALSLPKDLKALEQDVRDSGAVLIALDPLMSRLDGAIDSHKDHDVRQALEPLTALADRTGAAVTGLIHVNKSHGTDPLTLIMGSRAFAAVARAVLFVMTDPEDETTRLVGLEKNNLGRTDLPTLTFKIASAHVGDTPEGEVWTGQLQWTGESQHSIRDALESVGEGSDVRSATGEAGDWLTDYLQQEGGIAESADIKREGNKAGHSERALARARVRLHVISKSEGFPCRTRWSLPGTQLCQPVVPTSGESGTTDITGTTGTTEASLGPVVPGVPVVAAPREVGTTAAPTGADQTRPAGSEAPLRLVEPAEQDTFAAIVTKLGATVIGGVE